MYASEITILKATTFLKYLQDHYEDTCHSSDGIFMNDE